MYDRSRTTMTIKSIQIRCAVAKTGGALTSRGGAFQKPPKREGEL